MYKHILDNAFYIFQGMGLTKVSIAEMIFSVTHDHWIYHTYEFLSVFYCNEVPAAVPGMCAI